MRSCFEAAIPEEKRKAGTAKRHRTRQLVPAAGQRGDYRSILRGLSSYREDSRLNLDEFQYSWYTYGLEMYGNMPLIEPLEYSEERKIADLVIVIDTSGSCEKELVRVFLEETRGILEQDRLFFRSFCLHLIQCDNQIQRTTAFTAGKNSKNIWSTWRSGAGAGQISVRPSRGLRS